MANEKKDTTELMQDMDRAAEEAKKDLANVDQEAVQKVTEWWKKHYMKAGHKRLGRVLVKGI